MLDDKMTCREKELIVNESETELEHRFSWLCEVPAESEIGKVFQSNNPGRKRFLNKVREGDLK